MTALLWLLTWLLQLLPAVSELPQPVNLTLNSRDFRTMLEWQPGAETPTGAYYQVTFNTDRGTSWMPVPGCERVQDPLVCNLTDAFSDPNNSYLVQVTTVLGANKSQPASYSNFQLIRDSQLYLPLVTVTPCDKNLCMDLQFPKLYVSYMSQHHRDIYNSSLTYKVKINDAEKPKEFTYLKKHIVAPLVSGREFCVAVCFWNSLESRKSNYSQPVCVSIPGIISQDVWLSAGLCVLAVIGFLIAALRWSPGLLYPPSPLPPVLMSVPHIEDVPIITSSSISLTVVLAKLPSSGEGGHKLISSDESDGESETESSGGENELREAADVVSCSSVTSTSSSPQTLPSSKQTSCSSSAGTHRLSTNTDRGPVEPTEPDEEEQEEREGDSQDVNLLTVTVGRLNMEDEEEQESLVEVAAVERMTPSASDDLSIPLVQPSHPDTREGATEIMSCSSEDEEEHSGYMGRPCTAVEQTFL